MNYRKIPRKVAVVEGSNPDRRMDVCPRFEGLFCRGRASLRIVFPSQESPHLCEQTAEITDRKRHMRFEFLTAVIIMMNDDDVYFGGALQELRRKPLLPSS
jgi:hypothetical protein